MLYARISELVSSAIFVPTSELVFAISLGSEYDYISETHQTRQGNTTTPTETAHFL